MTLNIGAGKNTALLDKGVKLLKVITGIEPVKTITQKRIPGWGLRAGLPIGCKITLRKEAARSVLSRLLLAKNNVLKDSQFDENGNVGRHWLGGGEMDDGLGDVVCIAALGRRHCGES